MSSPTNAPPAPATATGTASATPSRTYILSPTSSPLIRLLAHHLSSRGHNLALCDPVSKKSGQSLCNDVRSRIASSGGKLRRVNMIFSVVPTDDEDGVNRFVRGVRKTMGGLDGGVFGFFDEGGLPDDEEEGDDDDEGEGEDELRDCPLHVIPPASSTSTSSDGSTKRKRQPHKDTFKQYLLFNRALLCTSVKDHQERSEGREDEDGDDEDDTTNRDEGKTKTKRGFSIINLLPSPSLLPSSPKTVSELHQVTSQESIITLTRTVAKEYGKYGVRCNVVTVGPTILPSLPILTSTSSTGASSGTFSFNTSISSLSLSSLSLPTPSSLLDIFSSSPTSASSQAYVPGQFRPSAPGQGKGRSDKGTDVGLKKEDVPQRRWGRAGEELGGLVEWLCCAGSNAGAAYITGAVIPLDGGLSIP